MLNDLDSGCLSIAFIFWRIFYSIEQHCTLGWPDHTGDHFAKGAFASPIGTNKGVNLAFLKFEAHRVDGSGRKVFGE